MIRACPKGLGSPVFDKLEAELAKALMSLPASKASLHGPTYSANFMCSSVWHAKRQAHTHTHTQSACLMRSLSMLQCHAGH